MVTPGWFLPPKVVKSNMHRGETCVVPDHFLPAGWELVWRRHPLVHLHRDGLSRRKWSRATRIWAKPVQLVTSFWTHLGIAGALEFDLGWELDAAESRISLDWGGDVPAGTSPLWWSRCGYVRAKAPRDVSWPP